MLDIIEKIVSIGCSILSLIIAFIALFKSNEAIRIATEKENKKISKILEKLSNSEYALINKKENSTSKFVYRRSFVEVVKCGSLEECENELNELNFKAPWGKYAIINVKKLKY